MVPVEKLKELFVPILEACDVKLYSLKWIGSGKNKTLEVAIRKKDGSMDLDTCAIVSEKLSEALDSIDTGNDAYTLDVCSPGAEQEIEDVSILKDMKEPYVYLQLHKPIEKKMEYTGTVTDIDDKQLKLSYQEKARKKNVEIPLENIRYIRFAVKL